ncbi:MAG TPA: glycosyltransferase family 61 protein [Flavipsychrobacter sp.]|nr:glycosyltransferase family 61 protein [Flavipsychrobacter sp.]
MILRGKGLRSRFNKMWIILVKSLFPPGLFYNTPSRYVNIRKLLIEKDKTESIVDVFAATEQTELLPEIYNYRVTERFGKYANRTIPTAYVVRIKNGKVYGSETNIVLTSTNLLAEDLSREFGAYGGRKTKDISVLRQKRWLPEAEKVNGRVAVVTTTGCTNFHHWNYDCLPRLFLIKQAGLFAEVDYFLISHQDLPFQKESLQLMGIPKSKIINNYGKRQLLQADELIVPSLPSILGTVSPWVVYFLRDLYNPKNGVSFVYERIFISRKNVTTRHIRNNQYFLETLKTFGIAEIYPEDYSVNELSKVIAGAKFIISIHGSGLANLCFIRPGTIVVDILAPYHQDAYYWLITNICGGRYIGFFGEGSHPNDDLDLVKHKIDENIVVDTRMLQQLLNRELSR